MTALDSYLRFVAALGWPMSQLLRYLQLNLFERRTLQDLLKPPNPELPGATPQLTLEEP